MKKDLTGVYYCFPTGTFKRFDINDLPKIFL